MDKDTTNGVFQGAKTAVLENLTKFLANHSGSMTEINRHLDPDSFKVPESIPADEVTQIRVDLFRQVRERLPAIVRLTPGLDALSAEQKEVILLVDGCGARYNEAVRACERPLGTIRSQLNRARWILDPDMMERRIREK